MIEIKAAAFPAGYAGGMTLSADLLAKYAARPVPRYTSYPTAVQFHEGIDAWDYAGALSRLPEGEAVSLYAHVPFCDTMCWFCGCHTKLTRRYAPVAEYLQRLKREVDMLADLTGQRPAGHMHWGGGSPTILAPADILDLARHIYGRFPRQPGSEFAIEIDPRGLARETIQAMAEAGVNRVSIGVQDIDTRVQKAVNRLQSLDETAQVIGWLREAGIAAVNIDLIYGLPHQTVESVAATARAMAALGPSRLAVFGYAHVPWMKKHMRLIDEASLPDGPARWAQAQAIADTLLAAGYEAVGLDHFARPEDSLVQAMRAGRLRRNFQGYTVDASETLLGLGASSIGALPDLYVQNVVPLDRYAAAIDAGRLAVTRGVRLSALDRLRRAVIERLMCDLRVDVAEIARQFGMAPQVLLPSQDTLQGLAEDGIVQLNGWAVSVPDAYRPLVRLAAAAFDAHAIPVATPRHAKAV